MIFDKNKKFSLKIDNQIFMYQFNFNVKPNVK